MFVFLPTCSARSYTRVRREERDSLLHAVDVFQRYVMPRELFITRFVYCEVRNFRLFVGETVGQADCLIFNSIFFTYFWNCRKGKGKVSWKSSNNENFLLFGDSKRNSDPNFVTFVII